MIKPGRFPFVLGTDIVALSRYKTQTALSLRKLSWRILHPAEISHLAKQHPSWYEYLTRQLGHSDVPMDNGLFSQWLAGRWAAKEAARKAWGARLLGFRDVFVKINQDGVPYITCRPWQSIPNLHPQESSLTQKGALSISHDGDYATATVIAEPLHQELKDLFIKRQQSVLNSMHKMETTSETNFRGNFEDSKLSLRPPNTSRIPGVVRKIKVQSYARNIKS